MSAAVLSLLAVQGALGAFDTVYYHEWRARLPAHGARVGTELKLHAARDFIYAIVFGTLPSVAWEGAWAFVLGALLAAEIGITLADFIVEDRVRRPLGGVYSGERATHAVMEIVYGAMLALLVPVMVRWSFLPTALAATVDPGGPPLPALVWILRAMAVGVFLSGLRDLAAALKLPGAAFPWRR
jgi:hypothetical protein